MKEIDVVNICIEVLDSLVIMASEDNKEGYEGQLIFPNKIQKGEAIKRISEQELRQLFIEKFNNKHKKLYYSIETPTIEKYNFKEDVKIDKENGQSALIDMSVFEGSLRKINIEFKYGNAPLKNIAKDVLKLMHEEQDGAFIFLLKNTDSGTLCNKGKTGVLDKLSESFVRFKDDWRNGNDIKHIQIIILSLEQKKNTTGPAVLIHRTIIEKKLKNLKSLFSINSYGCGNSGWEIEPNKLS